MPDSPSPSDRSQRKGDDQSWESWVDQLIREAQARGEFDNLPGKGKPLAERRNPFLPDDSQIAFDLIQNSGYTLPWIDDARDIDGRVEAARRKLSQDYAWYQQQRQQPGADLPALTIAWEKQRGAFAAEVTAINRLIDTYNLKAPSPQLHKLRLILAEEYARVENAS